MYKQKLIKYTGTIYLLGLFMLSVFTSVLISCSNNADTDPVSNLMEIPGKGTPLQKDVELKVVSDSMVMMTFVDTMTFADYDHRRWDLVLSTVINNSLEPLLMTASSSLN